MGVVSQKPLPIALFFAGSSGRLTDELSGGMTDEPRQMKTGQHLRADPLVCLAEWTGLEPATPGVTGRYSNQLNYHSFGLSPSGIAVERSPQL